MGSKTVPKAQNPAAEKLRVLVVEDSKLAQEVMAQNLGAHSVKFADDFEAACGKLAKGTYDICFIDLRLGEKDEGSGLKVIPMAVAKGIYSVVMSGLDTENMVGEAYELGCDGFYAKGNEEASVAQVIAQYRHSRTGLDSESIFQEQFVTEDPATRADVLEALKFAASGLPIMVLGPSGTGKTRLGRIIHEHSDREGAFVDINCAAYPEDLLEAELFGCKKGAFTGAAESRKGKLLQAHKGTLFLDEVGAMSLGMQAKLLKAIEERSFHPLGSDEPECSDFRIMSATLEDLQRLTANGRLRPDFFQRIRGLTVSLKPLAQRTRDIFPLIEFFTRGGKRLAFTDDAKACLLGHSWPGNARELKKLVDLLAAGTAGRVTKEGMARHLAWAVQPPEGSGGSSEDGYRCAVEHGLDAAVDRFEAGIVRRNLQENGGKRVKTLAQLRISARRFYAALKKQTGPEVDGNDENAA